MERPGVESISIALVGTYPPTKCGIATFTASLAKAVASASPGCRVGVVACVEHPRVSPLPPVVVAELVHGSTASRVAAAAALDRFDVVLVQHEFGIFGGADGDEIVDLIERLHVPVIVVLHTVPREPTPGQRAVIERLVDLAAHLVAQSTVARARLLSLHDVDPAKVSVIQHGAPANLVAERPPSDPARSPVVLTWGLIGPGKGLEFGIEAIALLRDLEPPPRYVIAGQTHPRILEKRGEEYRDSLVAKAATLGVGHLVSFESGYRDLGSILERIRDADIVLLPYVSRDQVVSGVLVEAIASGKPTVATRFPHAEELLGEGSGLLVAHEDAGAIAAALRALLTDPARAAEVAAVARRQAPSLFWESVGENYLRLAIAVIGDSMPDLVTALQPLNPAQAAARSAATTSAATTVAAPTQQSAAP